MEARFALGEIVHHLKVGYRGVVFGVDAEFSLSDEWYENVALSRPPQGPALVSRTGRRCGAHYLRRRSGIWNQAAR